MRAEVWKYLLGHYEWSSTKAQRDEVAKQRKDDYYRMKLQWRTISEDQEKRFSEYRDRKALIGTWLLFLKWLSYAYHFLLEKDVARTDRNHRFYEGESNTHLDTLTSVLLTYVMYNFDIGKYSFCKLGMEPFTDWGNVGQALLSRTIFGLKIPLPEIPHERSNFEFQTLTCLFFDFRVRSRDVGFTFANIGSHAKRS